MFINTTARYTRAHKKWVGFVTMSGDYDRLERAVRRVYPRAILRHLDGNKYLVQGVTDSQEAAVRLLHEEMSLV